MDIKCILVDIAGTAYPDFTPAWKLSNFRIEFHSGESRVSFNADYARPHKERKYGLIRLYNFHRDQTALITTCIHELAHHIDGVINENYGHGPSFYEVYEKLLFAAFDMGVLDVKTFMPETSVSGSQKVLKMLKRYEPHPVSYKQDSTSIRVLNGFKHKDFLKSSGFTYNSANTAWEKEVDKDSLDALTEELNDKEIPYEIVSGLNYSFKKKTRYLIAGKGSFDIRNELKDAGFFYSGTDKSWKMKVPADVSERILMAKYKALYPNVKWSIS